MNIGTNVLMSTIQLRETKQYKNNPTLKTGVYRFKMWRLVYKN